MAAPSSPPPLPKRRLTHPSGGRALGARLLRLEPLWLLLLTPLLLLPGRLLPASAQWVVVLAALLGWPLRLLVQGRITPPTPVRLAAGLLLLCYAVAIAVAADRTRAWEVAGYTVLGVAWANALLNWPLAWPAPPRQPAWAAAALLALGGGLLLLGPLIVSEADAPGPFFVALQRAGAPLARRLGETINPNILAHALLACAPLAAALLLRGGWTRRRWLRPLLALYVAWALAVFYMTQSRAAFLALAVVALLLLMLRWPRLLRLTPLVIAATVALFALQGSPLLEALTIATVTSGVAERLEIWQRALYAMHDFPLTGLGLGNFDRVAPLLYPYTLIPPTVDIPDAHNLLLHVGADLGLPGLVCYGALLLGLLLMAGSVLRRSAHNPQRWALAAGALAALAGMQVAGIFGAVNWGVKPTVIAWLLYTLIALLHRDAYREQP